MNAMCPQSRVSTATQKRDTSVYTWMMGYTSGAISAHFIGAAGISWQAHLLVALFWFAALVVIALVARAST